MLSYPLAFSLIPFLSLCYIFCTKLRMRRSLDSPQSRRYTASARPREWLQGVVGRHYELGSGRLDVNFAAIFSVIFYLN